MLSTIVHASILIFGTMTIFFTISILKKDNSIIDIAWPLGFMQIALYLVYQHPNPGTLQYACTILILLWGLRLAVHLAERNERVGEDPRYRQWRIDWSKHGQLYFFIRSFLQVFMLQGIILIIISLPIMAIQTDHAHTTLSMINLLGLGVWVAGFLFEMIADYQLANFKRTNNNPQSIMDSGLWQYSRHPNYFGESLMWWGLWLMAIQSQYGLLAVASPITITLLLLFVSGVPLAEKSLEHLPAFAAYRKKTSAFFPLPPKKDNAS